MGEKSLEAELRVLMASVQITTWQQLSRQTGISTSRLQKLRQGQIDRLKLGELRQLSQTFQIPLDLLLAKFGGLGDRSQITDPAAQRVANLQEFQFTSIQIIESFLTYWPAAAHQAQLQPEFAASKLLPLVKPIERLLATWAVRQIDPVGAIVAFNPQHHRAIAGQIQPGELVTVRYPGYQQGEKLLFRAQVSRP